MFRIISNYILKAIYPQRCLSDLSISVHYFRVSCSTPHSISFHHITLSFRDLSHKFHPVSGLGVFEGIIMCSFSHTLTLTHTHIVKHIHTITRKHAHTQIDHTENKCVLCGSLLYVQRNSFPANSRVWIAAILESSSRIALEACRDIEVLLSLAYSLAHLPFSSASFSLAVARILNYAPNFPGVLGTFALSPELTHACCGRRVGCLFAVLRAIVSFLCALSRNSGACAATCCINRMNRRETRCVKHMLFYLRDRCSSMRAQLGFHI